MTASLFCGCGATSTDAAVKKIVETAFEKNSELNDITYKYTNNVTYNRSGSSYYVKTVTDYKGHNLNDAEKFEMSQDRTVTYSTTTNQITNEIYYKDGFYYTDVYSGNFKVKGNPDDFYAVSRGLISGITFDDMRSYSLEENDDGEKTVTFSCKNSKLREFISQTDSDDDWGDYEINNGSGIYKVNKKGYLIAEELRVSVSYTEDGEDYTTILVAQAEYTDVGKEVDPYDPEDSEYVLIDSLDDIAALSLAMSSTLTADSYKMTAQIDIDNIWNSQKPQYKRDYTRIIDTASKVFKQDTVTTYYSDGTKGDSVTSSQYYTGGKYYNYGELYSVKVYCPMDFDTFYDNIYISNSVTPADIISVGLMKDIKTEKKDNETVYTFGLNGNNDDGINFISSLYGPYDTFDGDFSSAEIEVVNFTGKIYINEKGEYYRTQVQGKIKCTFTEDDEEYTVITDLSQDIKITDINKTLSPSFPKLTGYERTELSELLGAYMDGSD